jgi:hypothetical protein
VDTINGLQLSYALAYSVGVWAWTFALLGIGLRFMSAYSPVRRYVADASYWIYLVHLPIVLALQVLVSRWSWPWPAKLAFILGVAMATMLLSYQWFVRYGAIGGVLNGKRRQRPTATPAVDGATAVKVT